MFTPRAVNTISKFVELWNLKSQRLGKDGYFDCVEDFAVSVRASRAGLGPDECEITFQRATMVNMRETLHGIGPHAHALAVCLQDAICEITFGESYQCLEMALDSVNSMPMEVTKREPNGAVHFSSELPAIYTATQDLSDVGESLV